MAELLQFTLLGASNSMIKTLKNIKRLLVIVRILAKYNTFFLLERAGVFSNSLQRARRLIIIGQQIPFGLSNKRPGERLSLAFRELGPIFIKLGQALSVRRDLVGDEVAEDLCSLQDELEPFPAIEAIQVIEKEFGRSIKELFLEFNETPVAAASIAQVHFGVTSEGEKVAIKILRPGIENIFSQELDLLFWLGKTIDRYIPNSKRLRIPDVIAVLAETVSEEMDFRLEAAAGDELRENFANDPIFHVPRMDWKRTSKRVLTLERIEGFPADEVEAIKATGQNTKYLVANMARLFFLQVFRDGFFHADMHPGNMMISEDGTLQPIDFGIMGRIDRQTRFYLAEMLVGFLNSDYDRVAKIHFQAGYVPANQSEKAFAQAVRAIGEPILGLPLNQISLARLLAQLFDVTKRFKMETQPQLLLLQKTMLVAEGVGRQLHPETNMWELARPLIEDWVKNQMSVENRISEVAEEAKLAIERLPFLISEIGKNIESFRRDGIKINPGGVQPFNYQRKSKSKWMLWTFTIVIGLVYLIFLRS